MLNPIKLSEVDAYYYLDEWGHEIEREEFVEQIEAGYNTGLVLHVGSGFVKLRMAILTFGRDDSSAERAFQDWCRRNDRQDEINEHDPTAEDYGEYESYVQWIEED